MTRGHLLLTFLLILVGLGGLISGAFGLGGETHREVAVIADEEGFYPDTLVVFKGEKITLFLTGAGVNESCFIMDEGKIFLGVKKGEVKKLELVFNSKGRFPFYCPKGKVKGEEKINYMQGKLGYNEGRFIVMDKGSLDDGMDEAPWKKEEVWKPQKDPYLNDRILLE